MKTTRFGKNFTGHRKLACKSKQFQHQTEYGKVLDECDGNINVTELIMFLKKQDPEFENEPHLPGQCPELKLVKK